MTFFFIPISFLLENDFTDTSRKKKWWLWWNVLTFDWTKLLVAYTENKNNFLRARTNYFVVVYVRSDGNNLRISTLEISVLIKTGEFLLNGSSSISSKFFTLNYTCLVIICGDLYFIFNRRSAQLHLIGKYVPIFTGFFLGFRNRRVLVCLVQV